MDKYMTIKMPLDYKSNKVRDFVLLLFLTCNSRCSINFS